MTFVSIHIPKTAGTSLGQVFDYSSGRRVFWDYDPGYRFALDLQPEVRENLGFISSYFSFIHGHFFYAKYADLLPNAKFITCVRHPVDRVISQYHHVAYGGDATNWQANLIRRGEMNAVQFASSDKNISSAMSRHLAGRRPEDFDFVFISERLMPDLEAFSLKFDFKVAAPVRKLNAGESRIKLAAKSDDKIPAVSDDDRRKIFNICAEDVSLYAACQALKKA